MLVLFCALGVANAGLGETFMKILNKTRKMEEEIEEELEEAGFTYAVIMKNTVWFLVGGVAGTILMLSVWLASKMVVDPKPHGFNQQDQNGVLEQNNLLDEKKKNK
uniref:Uncharacterized protein n=1 Tax=Heterosigma akashiwo TaxID=2829 RepID=A0A7S4D6L5_HETAK